MPWVIIVLQPSHTFTKVATTHPYRANRRESRLVRRPTRDFVKALTVDLHCEIAAEQEVEAASEEAEDARPAAARLFLRLAIIAAHRAAAERNEGYGDHDECRPSKPAGIIWFMLHLEATEQDIETAGEEGEDAQAAGGRLLRLRPCVAALGALVAVHLAVVLVLLATQGADDDR